MVKPVGVKFIWPQWIAGFGGKSHQPLNSTSPFSPLINAFSVDAGDADGIHGWVSTVPVIFLWEKLQYDYEKQ